MQLQTAAPPASVLSVRAAGRPTDADLVAAVRAGDDRAFERLYARYHRRIGAYVQGMVQDHAKAEDITQEVFVSALRRMRDTDRPITFKPWVYEIAKNACIDAFRRARRATLVSLDVDGDGPEALEGRRLAGREPTPEAAVDRKLELETLTGAFGGLTDAHHQILVMRELEGLTYKEIGDRLAMSRASVESTLFRARRRLEEEYAELLSGERCRRVQATLAERAGTRLGVRDEKRMARHVSYCQACRRAAVAAGVDVAALSPRPIRSRIAAWLPLPLVLRRWIAGDGGAGSLSGAAQYAEPLAGGWAKAGAVLATVALAGAGTGAVTHAGPLHLGGGGHPAADRVAAPVRSHAPAAAAGGGATAASPAAGAAQRRATASAGRRGRGGAAAGPGAGAGTTAARPGATRDGNRASGSSPADAVGGASTTVTNAAGGTTDAAKRTTAAVPVVPKVLDGVDKVLGGGTTTSGTGTQPVADTVQGVTGTAQGTVDKTVGTVTGAVGTASGTVTGAVGTATGTVGTVTDGTGSTSTAGTGTSGTGTLDTVTDTVSGLAGGGG